MKVVDPSVYIVILNWNGYADTVECIESLKEIDYKNFRIILVDNGSTNKEAERLKKSFPNIKLLSNKSNRGYAQANNQGIDLSFKAGAKYTLLLNNDTVVKKDFLNVLVNYAEINNFKGILTPKILFYKTTKIWAVGGKISVLTSIPRMLGQGKPSGYYQKITKPDYAPGCALFINNKTLKEVGKLNPIYFAYYEDADLSFRVKKSNYQIKAIPKSIVLHKVSQSTKNKGSFRIGATQSYLLARNGVIFAKLNLFGVQKLIYLLSQYLIKLPLYLVIKCQDFKSKKAYLKGASDGSQFLLKNKNILDRAFINS